jgi:hypothetical protein
LVDQQLRRLHASEIVIRTERDPVLERSFGGGNDPVQRRQRVHGDGRAKGQTGMVAAAAGAAATAATTTRKPVATRAEAAAAPPLTPPSQGTINNATAAAAADATYGGSSALSGAPCRWKRWALSRRASAGGQKHLDVRVHGSLLVHPRKA